MKTTLLVYELFWFFKLILSHTDVHHWIILIIVFFVVFPMFVEGREFITWIVVTCKGWMAYVEYAANSGHYDNWHDNNTVVINVINVIYFSEEGKFWDSKQFTTTRKNYWIITTTNMYCYLRPHSVLMDFHVESSLWEALQCGNSMVYLMDELLGKLTLLHQMCHIVLKPEIFYLHLFLEGITKKKPQTYQK